MGWGYVTKESEKANTVWDARAIIEGESFSILHDRQSIRGNGKKIAGLLNGGVLAAVRDKVTKLRKAGEIRADEAKEHVLYDDDELRVVGNTNASFGYLYLVGFIKEK